MNFIDPYNKDKFEDWLSSEKANYEKQDQYTYAILIKEVLNLYRNYKENQKGVRDYGREE